MSTNAPATQETETMTILSAMKKVKLIEKQISSKNSNIQQYSSQPSNEVPLAGDDNAQQKKIKELVQSVKDLVEDAVHLNARINYTNLTIKVKINGKTYSIHDLLQYKRKWAKVVEGTISSMNDSNFKSRGVTPGDVVIKRYYDTNLKNEELSKIQEFYHEIDSRLETINATQPLLDLPVE